MKAWLVSLLSEEDGSASTMRVMAILSLISAIVLAFLGKDHSVTVFVTSAFSAKIVQKHIEKSSQNK